ncbi:hypothetical protein D3C72_1353980 [compost metagenome]
MAEQNSQIDVSSFQPVLQLRALPLANTELHQGVALLQAVIKRADQRVCSRRKDADAHHADRLARSGVDVVDKLVGAGHPGPDLGCYALAELRQHDAASRPLEQAPTALLFQFAELAADMRLARAIGLRHLAQAAQICSCQEQLPRGVVHR